MLLFSTVEEGAPSARGSGERRLEHTRAGGPPHKETSFEYQVTPEAPRRVAPLALTVRYEEGQLLYRCQLLHKTGRGACARTGCFATTTFSTTVVSFGFCCCRMG